MDWISILGIVMASVANIGALAYAYGTMRTEISVSQKEITELKEDMRALRVMKEEMAAVKQQLLSIDNTLHRLERALIKDE